MSGSMERVGGRGGGVAEGAERGSKQKEQEKAERVGVCVISQSVQHV